MAMQPQPWRPQENRECYFSDFVDGQVISIPIAVRECPNNNLLVWHYRKDGKAIDGSFVTGVSEAERFSPVADPGANYREKQANRIQDMLAVAGFYPVKIQTCYELFESGFRVLGPNEEVRDKQGGLNNA